MLTQVESVDEYSPAFAAKSYTFPVDRLYPAGHIVGRVTASDEDAGILLYPSFSISLFISFYYAHIWSKLGISIS